MAPPRILLCGDVLGRLNLLFKRVSTVNKSNGPFDALLCVGQFFSDSPDRLEEISDYIDGPSSIPLPTYFIGDYGIGAFKILSVASKDPSNLGFKTDGLKICHNLFWLKGSGKFPLLGLSIAYLSGRHSSDDQPIGVYCEDDIDALRALAEEPGIVDLFLTNEWPSEILNRADTSDAPPGVSNPSGSDPVISQLAAEIKPRYHIAGTKGVFYAREPYSNDGAVHVTRFLGLAPVGNKDKQKFIHAISPTPASTMPAAELCMKPPNTTLSPYTVSEKTDNNTGATKRISNSTSDEQYWRFDVSKRQRKGNGDGERLCFKFTSTGSCSREEKCNFRHDIDAREQYLKGGCFDFINKGKCERGSACSFQHGEEGDGLSQKRTRSKIGGDTSATDGSQRKHCWFCLSSPNVESHLILSIGENCYCALAKGPLVEDHVLIVPVDHCPNTLSLAPEAETELHRYKSALKTYFKNQGKAVVYYEWLFKHGLSMHANLQAIPVPISRASDVRSHFILAAKKSGFEFEVVHPSRRSSESRNLLRSKFDEKSSFFYAELPEGTILSYSVEDKEKFPVQFGREVLASLLNVPDRADWRNCKLSKEDETQMAEHFKKRFEEFDPTR
ncbi:cwfJ-like family protein / zinc finger (CCCH-type) family protein isoform X1 [Tasmannia lanceolata]|uniref:cwfJ-like family protein / zinc finger (CCCH-type) family protein isoform X1 n=1 Tax=Tasmannia lanceolata TaxID=3420 RepID=UPI004064C3DF